VIQNREQAVGFSRLKVLGAREWDSPESRKLIGKALRIPM